MADEAKISPYSLSDCKHTTDDALENYLNSLKFKQSHFLTDVKLSLGYIAVIVSAITFAYDYKLGFENTKYWTVGTVLLYFLLNTAFSYWIYFVEKDTIFQGSTKSGKINLSTKTKKFDPTYRVKVRYTTSPSSNDWKEVEVSAPFSRWFTKDGRFVAQPFQQWLASSVNIIGQADPKTLAGPADHTLAATASASGASVSGSNAGASSKRSKA